MVLGTALMSIPVVRDIAMVILMAATLYVSIASYMSHSPESQICKLYAHWFVHFGLHQWSLTFRGMYGVYLVESSVLKV
jgi:hypothetical protein